MIKASNALTSIKMFLTKVLAQEELRQLEKDTFLIELSSYCNSLVSTQATLRGPAKTEIIRGFFRGMKRK